MTPPAKASTEPIYASILQADGQHADFRAGDGARHEVRVENGTLVVHVRDGSDSVRLRIGGALLDAIAQACAPKPS